MEAALPGRAAAVTLRMLQICMAIAVLFVLPAIRIGPHRDLPPHVRFRLVLQRLGGAWVKVGQALALRST